MSREILSLLLVLGLLLGGCAPLVVGAAGGLVAYEVAQHRHRHHCWRDAHGIWHSCKVMYHR
jgi:hypothetical protein